jgi:hypothetical protein
MFNYLHFRCNHPLLDTRTWLIIQFQVAAITTFVAWVSALSTVLISRGIMNPFQTQTALLHSQ